MEHDHELEFPEAEGEGYTPRPKWQVWGARLAAVLFVLLILLQILGIARGGL